MCCLFYHRACCFCSASPTAWNKILSLIRSAHQSHPSSSNLKLFILLIHWSHIFDPWLSIFTPLSHWSKVIMPLIWILVLSCKSHIILILLSKAWSLLISDQEEWRWTAKGHSLIRQLFLVLLQSFNVTDLNRSCCIHFHDLYNAGVGCCFVRSVERCHWKVLLLYSWNLICKSYCKLYILLVLCSWTLSVVWTWTAVQRWIYRKWVSRCKHFWGFSELVDWDWDSGVA